MIRIVTPKFEITDGIETFDIWLSNTESSTLRITLAGPLPADEYDLKIIIMSEETEVMRGYGSISSTNLMAENYLAVLASKRINRVFLNCTPQEIIRYSMNGLGLNLKLSDKAFSKRAKFVIANETPLTILERINSEWQYRMSYWVDGDNLNWSDVSMIATQTVKYQSGVNIIELSYSDGQGIVTGFVDFKLRPGMGIEIDDPDVPEGRFTINKLHHYKRGGKSRTDVYYKVVE